MSLDGLLTFLTIIVAAYTVMPTVTRLRLALRSGWLIMLSIVGGGFVIYFEFFTLFSRSCPSSLGKWCSSLTITEKSPVQADQAAFIVVAVWLILVFAIVARTKLSARSLPAFSRLATELAYERKYSELIELIDPQLPLLNKAATRQLLFRRLREYVIGLDPFRKAIRKIQEKPDLLPNINKGAKKKHDKPSFKNDRYDFISRNVSKWAWLAPAPERQEDAAQEILRLISRTPDIIEFITQYRPEFGVKYLSMTARGVKDFGDYFIPLLMSNPQSVLYQEIRYNENLAKCGYDYPPHNKLLHFLFADARNSERLRVYKPVGEHLLSSLRKDQHPDYIEYLNGDTEFFIEEEKMG